MKKSIYSLVFVVISSHTFICSMEQDPKGAQGVTQDATEQGLVDQWSELTEAFDDLKVEVVGVLGESVKVIEGMPVAWWRIAPPLISLDVRLREKYQNLINLKHQLITIHKDLLDLQGKLLMYQNRLATFQLAEPENVKNMLSTTQELTGLVVISYDEVEKILNFLNVHKAKKSKLVGIPSFKSTSELW